MQVFKRDFANPCAHERTFRRNRFLTPALIGATLVISACENPTSESALEQAFLQAAPSCGATITENTVLTADLLGCPGNGLIIGASNITLDGDGHTIEYGASGADGKVGVIVSGHSYVTIKNLSIVDVNAAGTGGRGIYLQGTASNNQLLDNVIQTNGVGSNNGIIFFGSGVFDSNIIRGNQITTNGTADANIGIFMVGGSNNLIEYNTIQTNGTINNIGVYLLTSPNLTMTRNTIRENVITTGGSGSVNDGIRISGASTDSTRIDGNTITTNGPSNTAGITLRGNTSGNRVENNRIVTHGTGGNNDGILLSSTSGNVIVDNVISTGGQTGRGFNIGLSTGNLLSGNTITTGIDGGGGEAFFVHSQSDRDTIANNAMTTVGTAVILDGVTGTVLSGNTIQTTSGEAIFLTNAATNNSIRGNTLNTAGTFGFGLHVTQNSTPNAVFRNNFLDIVGHLSYPGVKVFSDVAMEVSSNGEGNFWGRSCPGPLFVVDEDSNSPDVVDSFPFAAPDGWLTGGIPGCDPPDNTPTGPEIDVIPVDETTGEPSPISMTFDDVTGAGETTVESSGPGSGPPLPTQFKLGAPPTIYNIGTTATFTGSVEVCFDYSKVTYGNENTLKLLHYDEAIADWVDVTISLDTVGDIICGSVTSLSPFAVAQALTPEELLQAILNEVLALEDLDGNVAQSLASKLNNVFAGLDRGNANAAINQLQAFINEVQALIQSGGLDPLEGGEIIDVAETVIDELGG